MKTKFDRAVAEQVQVDLLEWGWELGCEIWTPAGSYRRGKEEIGDLELVYVPRFMPGFDRDLFGSNLDVNLADLVLKKMMAAGRLVPRKTIRGNETMGGKNKLMRHTVTQLPVDFFATTKRNYWNYLVCRTGGEANNIAICQAAKKRGMKWRPYEDGFDLADGTRLHCENEEAVFAAVGLPWKVPREREGNRECGVRTGEKRI